MVRARDHLLERQDRAGWWKGELETNVTMDAEDLLLRHFLGILDPGVAAAAAVWIRGRQRADGTWATFLGGPPDLSTTVEAYVALRLAGDPAGAPHMAAASAWVRPTAGSRPAGCSRGSGWRWSAAGLGVPAGAAAGADPPAALGPTQHLRVRLLGPPDGRGPLGDHAPTAPAVPCPSGSTSCAPIPRRRRPATPIRSHRRRAVLPRPPLDRILHRYERTAGVVAAPAAAAQAALRRAEQWIVQRQEADGCWGGIQPPLVYSVIALTLQGYALDHPVIAAALTGLEGFMIDDAAGRRLEACQSPGVGHRAGGRGPRRCRRRRRPPGAHRRAADWLLGEEVRVRGDWAVRRPRLAPGGWAFEFANDHYPDIDDTAEVVLALRRP